MKWLILFFLASYSYGFPQNARHGYTNCASCHINPNGGGILNEYGRALSEEFAYSSYEGEGKLLGFIKEPSFLKLGGNVRWLNYTSKSKAAGNHSKIFFMQTEAEIALSPIQNLWLVGTLGKYNEDDKYEQRRNYLLMQINPAVSFKAGKFFPSIGLNTADHRDFIHPGQGKETYNAELNYISQSFALNATALGKEEQYVHATKRDGYKRDEISGVSLQGRLLFEALGLGAYHVAQYDGVSKVGTFAYGGLYDYYGLLQFERQTSPRAHASYISYAEIGRGITKGLEAFARAQTKQKTYSYKAGLNFFPRPHWQLAFEIDRTIREYVYIDSLLVMIHYQL